MRYALLALAAVVVVHDPIHAQIKALGRANARLDHQFSAINGLRELPDGRLLVSDGIDDVVLRVDLAARRIDTVGRSGRGPGEYKSPDALFQLPAGGTLLVDLGNARLSVIDAAGKFGETVPIAQGQPGGGRGPVPLVFPRATDAQGRIYFQPVLGGPRSDSGVVVRWDRSAGRFDTVATVRLPAMVTKSSGGPGNQRQSQRQQPYPVQDSWAVASDGRLALVRSPTYRVDWVANGAKVVGRPIAATPVPIRDAEKKEYLAESQANGLSIRMENVNGRVSMAFSRGRQDRDGDNDEPDLSGEEWPAAKPAATGLAVVAADGRLLVERSVPAGSARLYDLIGKSGEVLGQVSLPVGRRLVAVGTRGLYARQTDQDGINYLERYDLP